MFEQSGEIGDVVVSAAVCNVGDAEFLFAIEQLLGVVDAKQGDVSGGVVAGDIIDFLVELCGRDSKIAGECCGVELVLPYECEDVVVEYVQELLLGWGRLMLGVGC